MKVFKIVFDEGYWVRLEDAQPNLGGKVTWYGEYGIFDTTYGIIPCHYFSAQMREARRYEENRARFVQNFRKWLSEK